MGRRGLGGRHGRHAATRTRIGVLTAIAAAAAAAPAAGVVTNNRSSISPAPGWVGQWNGSSGVPIGPHWVVSAKHVGGNTAQYFQMRGVYYRAVEIIQHPTYDMQLIRVAEELPGWHRLASGVSHGTPAILGGWGATAGADVTNGFDWTGPHQETWGANKVEGQGALLAVRFDAQSNPAAVPYEGIFAVHDSGAGLFVYGADGELELAAIAVSVTNYGSSLYGNVAYSLNVENLSSWIMPIVDPGAPISSSVVGPRASIVPGGPVSLALAVLAAAGAVVGGVRRRRRAAV